MEIKGDMNERKLGKTFTSAWRRPQSRWERRLASKGVRRLAKNNIKKGKYE